MKSEKPYKQIEDKIIAAVETPDYAFNEASWKKMEALLDKNKDRRRPLFWIFSIVLLSTLILAGGIIYKSFHVNEQFITATKKDKNVDTKNNEKPVLQPINKNDSDEAALKTFVPVKNTVNDYAISAEADKNTEMSDDKTVKTNKVSISKTKPTKQFQHLNLKPKALIANFKSNLTGLKMYKAKRNTSTENYNAANKNILKDRNKFAVNITAPDAETDITDQGSNNKVIYNDWFLTTVKTDSTAADLSKNKAVNKTDTAFKKINAKTKSTDKKEKNNKKVSGFYVMGTIGAEASSTKLFSYKNSTIAPVYGLGLGYQFNRRLSIQAGFYAAAKKYIAGPNDYSVKAGSYLSMVKIIKVDANCMVYQIPVTLQYNWLIKPRTNYYASVGLSSYIMKKEKYNYTYVRNNYQYSYPYDYTNNSHLAASLQFSLGIEKQIGRKFYLQAAPVFNIPLKGVGEGSVKIFTTGLQIGLKYYPLKH